MYGRGGAGNLAQAAASNKKAAEVRLTEEGCPQVSSAYLT